MKKICPQIHRQRVIIEAILAKDFHKFQKFIPNFIVKLSNFLEVKRIGKCHKIKIGHGLSIFQVWLESGLQFHTWPEENFWAGDIFTCKPFNYKLLKPFLHKTLKQYKIVSLFVKEIK